MKKLIRRLARAVYIWAGGDTIALARHALDVLPPIPDYLESLSQTERLQFVADCAAVGNVKSFRELLRFLMDAQKNVIAAKVEGAHIDFPRGTLNGYAIVSEELDRMVKRLDAAKDPKAFNPFEPL